MEKSTRKKARKAGLGKAVPVPVLEYFSFFNLRDTMLYNMPEKKPAGIEKNLIAEMAKMEIIDCHEHLPPESVRLAAKVDVFTLFSHYTHWDLLVAGMEEKNYRNLFNHDIPIEKRWETFKPFWERICWTSYSRAVLITAEKFFGVDDINDRTYRTISRKIQEANKPGLYENVIGKTCNIRVSLTQCGRTDLKHKRLIPVMPMVYEMETWKNLNHPPFEPQADIVSLDQYLDACRRYVIRSRSEGAVGLKMISTPHKTPDKQAALSAFESLKSGRIKELVPKLEFPGFPRANPLRDYVVDEVIRFAGEQNLVVAVHTGYWGDFRQVDPLHMIPLLQRHPEVCFDIYHVGYPWVREALMLGKGFANAWLNFAWTHIISQCFAMAALDEAIDLIPVNKILGFGGDYETPVEKIYGHLTMAREDIARVLAKRITGGQMTEKQALGMAKKWLIDNPCELYRLS